MSVTDTDFRRLGCTVLAVVLGVASLADGAADGDPTDEPRSIRARVMEIRGLDWRSDLHRGLLQVDNTGATSVWVAEPRALGRLLARATYVRGIRAEHGPEPKLVNFVGRMDRVADGPVDRAASTLGFRPEVGQVRDGLKLVATATPAGEGLVVGVEAEDSHIIAFHTVGYTETMPTGTSSLSFSLSFPFVQVGSASITAQYQIPEVVQTSIRGCWSIPAGKALILALGVHREEAGQGQDGLVERFVILDADDMDESEVAMVQQLAASARTTNRLVFWATLLAIPAGAVLVAILVRRRFRGLRSTTEGTEQSETLPDLLAPNYS